jgi:hypothetical protein
MNAIGARDWDIIQTPGRLNNPAGACYAYAIKRANIERRAAYERMSPVREDRARLRQRVMDLPEARYSRANVQSGYPGYWPFNVIRRSEVLRILEDM